MVANLKFDAKLKELENWYSSHDYLPEMIEPIVLRRYLHAVYDDLNEAKKLIEHSYKIRSKYPNIFNNRDPLNAHTQKMFGIADLSVPMPKLTADNYRVVLNRLTDFDAEKFDFDAIIKAFFLAADYRFTMEDNDCPMNINEGDVPIFDMTGFSYRHLTKLGLSTLRCYMKFTQECFPGRPREIHLINVSPVLNKILLILRPFMNANVRNLLNFHAPGTETLYEFVPLELLPKEYGGSAGNMKDIKSDYIKQIERQRDYLSSDKHWKFRDSNNNYTTNSKAIIETQSSFQSLDID